MPPLDFVELQGTSDRLEENLAAAALELTPEDLREIDSAVSQITVQGARYPEDFVRVSGR